ncbi:MAG: hypothetical protein ABS61_05625 [Microbacterium sp. SCN 70-18]|nr:winged helix-turn-helix domain-containing protein [Microbacterium chocolatum]ODT11061.1 MAG: hypothetical protein ABS61_05625 [Microbacterium sp. SCN 70-18]
MTLHVAIEAVLTSAGRPLTPGEIADEVNRRGLYARRDGTLLPPGQVSARVRKYPTLFTSTSDGIWVADSAVREIARAADQASQFRETPASAPEVAPGNEPPTETEADLLNPAHFRSARNVEGDVPNEFGLYAIRVRDVELLPDPYRQIAMKRASDLIYLGEATGQTLQQRFLRNELRGRGHGTFFRSIGAVLGYRPPGGSLVGKANQRNYRFSPADTAAIVEWINANLEVSWIAFEKGVHLAEVALIRKHQPLLNLRDNPAALPQLSELRAYCCAIAQGTALT